MNAHFPNSSATFSMMISRIAYKAVVGIESIIRFSGKMLQSDK